MVFSISILVFCQIAAYRGARAQMLKIKSQQVSKKAREVFFKGKESYEHHDSCYWRRSVLISVYHITTIYVYLSLKFTSYQTGDGIRL